jgi:hypothetical protein
MLPGLARQQVREVKERPSLRLREAVIRRVEVVDDEENRGDKDRE